MNRLAITLLLLTTVATAQDLGRKAPPQTTEILIIEAVIHPISGPVIRNGWVHLKKGRIFAIGKGSPDIDGEFDVVDAKGQHLYPGFVAPYTHLGLTEIGAVRASTDMTESGEINPEIRAAVAVNPDSTLLPVTRSNGVLTFATFPRGGAIPGRISVMSVDGWTWEEMALLADAGLVVAWPNPDPGPAPERRGRRRRPPPERGLKRLKRLREAFEAARAYLAAKEADAATPTDVRWEGMRSVLERKTPVFFLANDYAQITTALDFAATHRLRAVIVGGRDALLCADLLKQADVPIIVRGIHTFPRRNDSFHDEIYALPAKLEAAGIRWCLASGERTANERNLPYTAGRAVAFGLGRDAALRAITLRAAEILGVGKELGSLQAGKRATLFLCGGDPLEITTHVTAAWVDGKRLDLGNKQTALASKYREKLRQQRSGK